MPLLLPKKKVGNLNLKATAFDGRMAKSKLNYNNSCINYLDLDLDLDLLDFKSEAAALTADLASVVGLRTLLGLIAFLILNAAHAVPKA